MQTGKWKSIAKIVEDAGLSSKLKKPKAQRAWVVKQGYTISPDEEGNEGVVFTDQEAGVKDVKMGRRLSHSKVSQKEMESQEDLDRAAGKARHAVQVTMEQED